MMRRRSFLAALLPGFGLSAGQTLHAQPTRPCVELVRAPLAGYPYYHADEVLNSLRTGTPLALRREPDNPYDRHAIEVLTTGGIKIGYIPRLCAGSVARNLDRGVAVKAKICEINPGAPSWCRIHLECFVDAV